MTTENYNKYYVQGSDHYLIPRDELKLLLRENQELKKQVEVSNELVAQSTLIEMKLRNELFNKRKEYQDTYKDVRIEIKEYKTQQKEFIKWLENGIEKVKNTEFLDERIQRAGLIAYNRCLRKYKSIIGENKDEK